MSYGRITESLLREFKANTKQKTNVVSTSLVSRLKDVLEKKKPTIRTIVNTNTVMMMK